MKILLHRILQPLLLATLLVYARFATAQTSAYWDPGALNANPGSGGAGTWNSANTNWWVSGSTDTTWTNGNIATFAGTAGTVTVGANETANGLTFTTAGYTLAGSSTLTLGGATPTIAIPAGITTINPILAGTAGLTISGPGQLVLGAANTYSGGTTVSAGSALQINNVAGAGASSGTIALGTGGVLITSNRVNNVTVANPITGDATSVINMTLNAGFNTYLGGSLAGFFGTIVITNAGGPSGSDLGGANTAPPLTMPATAGGWIVASNAELYINVVGGVEAAPITINGPGYTGGYGAIRLDNGTVSGNILLNGSTTNNQIGGPGAAVVTFSGVISDGGHNYGLNMWGGGSTPASKVFVLSGQNTYGGPTTLSYGETRVGSAENPGVSGPLGQSNAQSVIYFSAQANAGATGGALQYSSANQYDYSGRFATTAGQKYRIDLNGQNVTFAKPLTSSGGTFLLFDTAGGGILTLNAANTYIGGTTISNGTLVANATGAIPAGPVTVGGGMLISKMAGAVPGSVTVNGGVLSASAAGSLLGNITLANTGALTISNSAALSLSATLILPASPANNSVNLNFSGTQNIGALYFGSTLQALGTWGAIGSSAANQSAAFTGSGMLNVTGATLLYWDANHTDAGSQSSSFGGGSGSWDNSTANWWYTGSSDAAWAPNGTATFAGTAGTVTLNANEAANGLTFTTAGYTIANGSGSVLTLGGTTPTITIPTGNTAIGCNLAGIAGLTESGSGTLVLSGTNTYTGATTISGGTTLTIGGAGQLGSGNYAGNIIEDGAALIYNSSATQTLSGVISGSGGTLTNSGSGTLTLGGANTYDGGTSINPGATLQITSKNGAGAGTITITSNGVFSVNTTGANSLANAVANIINGDSTSVINLDQTAGNTYFSSDLTGFSGTVFCVNSNSSSGAGNIVVQVFGPLALPSTATWNIASGATLLLGGSAGTCAANVVINGPGNNAGFGALRLDSVNVSGNVLLAGAGNNQIGGTKDNITCTISGVISDGGLGYGLNRVGYPPAVNSVLALSGQNTYSGVTTLTSNILQVACLENPGVSGPLGKSAASNPGSIVFAGGTLQYSFANQFDYSGRFSTAANELYNIDVYGQSVTFATPLSSSGGNLTLNDSIGGGTLTLSGANTYGGSTTINAGTLKISSSSSLAGNVTVNGGTLELDKAMALSATATIALPESPAAGIVNLNFVGTQTINALHFGTVFEAAGTWGAPGSGAVNENSAFVGAGILNVSTGRPYDSAFWDPNGIAASPGSGGTGIWDATTADWWASGAADTTWAGGASATFAGTAGTVTLNASTTANGLTFSTPDYILAGSSTLNLGGSTPTITIPARNTTINTILGGTAGLRINGPGRLVLGAANSYAGDTTVGAGSALQINNVTGAGASSGTIGLGSGGALITSNRVNNATVPNSITGDATSVINIILSSGANTYLGGSLANFYGTIVITNTGGPSGSDLGGMNTAPPLDMPATAGGWIVASNAEFYMNVPGGVEAAPIIINGPGYLPGGYGAIRLDNGTITGNILLNGSTTNNQIGGPGANAVFFSGVISDGGRNYGLNMWGGGSTPASKVFVLSGQNTYGGPTTLSYAETQVAAAENAGISGPLGRSNALSVIYFSAQPNAGANGGALQYSSANQFDYSSRFATSPGQKYKIDLNGQSVTFASPLTSSGGTFLLFDTIGGGTLTLTSASTYGGGTTIAGGTLHVSSGSIMGGVTVNSGTLQLDSPSSLSPGTTLTLISGVTVNLNYAGTQIITELFVDGIQQLPGVYGASANNPSGIFIGSGTLTVVGKSSTTISSAAINGANQLAISWASVPGANYNVYSTASLSQPIHWTLVNSSPIFATGTTTSYDLPGSIVGQPQLFVRVAQ